VASSGEMALIAAAATAASLIFRITFEQSQQQQHQQQHVLRQAQQQRVILQCFQRSPEFLLTASEPSQALRVCSFSFGLVSLNSLFHIS
jgi:ABC-type microcin C transport system duplicated ATPase subunit YejF